ncbi:hypothetical protein FGG08_007526 [Glutinoglossum americanum]|uniref:Uncharacterized protein n=1 Tax=Glutinoglossum americanum TaxID=1670608 RepID=A0A9P8KTT8_9PEZI|nr:hypothetical protein FGG08_007526 [Glutinoglossum americanum]
MGTQSDFEPYDFDAEKRCSLDPEFRFFDRPFERRVSIPPAAFFRRSSDVKMEQQKWARQSLQSQRTFYHARTPSNSSLEGRDSSPEPASTLICPKELNRSNRGHRKDSLPPLNLSQPRHQETSDGGSCSRPISPRATHASHLSVATSVESAPHFQTVDTWVDHQAARLDRKRNRGDPHSKRDEYHRHRRRDSGAPVPETPSAFRHHPGRAVSWGGASLVPSEVLDEKIGWR